MAIEFPKVEDLILEKLSEQTKVKILEFKDNASTHFKKNREYEIVVPRKEGTMVAKLFELKNFEADIHSNGIEAKIIILLAQY